ncbi:MAG: DUF5777 family beta-barrel protein [Allomuricauda sp.]
MKSRFFLTMSALVAFAFTVEAQKGLLDILDKEQKDTLPQYTSATFKTTRITYGHSVETRKKGILEVFISNRFWNTPELRSQSFGVDKINVRIALEYAISDRLSTGFGGSTWDGLFDGYLKYRLVRQRNDSKRTPFNVTIFQNANYNSSALDNPYFNDSFSGRLSYTSQVLLARKFNSKLSIQLAPTFVHKGFGDGPGDTKNHFALGFGGRYKLSNHVSLVSEYYTVFNPIESVDTYGPFGLGVNWEIGDVMLQFMLTNTPNMVEDAFITRTRNNFNFKNPNLNFGFNFTYVIHFNRKLKGLKQTNADK